MGKSKSLNSLYKAAAQDPDYNKILEAIHQGKEPKDTYENHPIKALIAKKDELSIIRIKEGEELVVVNG